jgi:hypothetical protein
MRIHSLLGDDPRNSIRFGNVCVPLVTVIIALRPDLTSHGPELCSMISKCAIGAQCSF